MVEQWTYINSHKGVFMTICRYCSSVRKNENSLRNHERLCKLNPNKQLTYFATNQEKLHRSNQFVKAKKLGLPPPVVSEETKNKIRINNSKRTEEWHKNNAKKISEAVKRKVKEGTWHTSLAKHMHYSYKGFDLHGKWELAYAKWLDKNNVKWIKCKESFEYFYENSTRRYTPDFFIIDENIYVEIKGYQTDKDKAKWSQFPKDKTLKVLFKNDLKLLDII